MGFVSYQVVFTTFTSAFNSTRLGSVIDPYELLTRVVLEKNVNEKYIFSAYLLQAYKVKHFGCICVKLVIIDATEIVDADWRNIMT